MGSPEVITVAFGRPATDALGARIAAAKATHPLDPVTVIVPSNAAGLTARRLLGSGQRGPNACGGLANVDFVTPLRLAERLGSARLGDRRPLTTPVLGAAVRAVLAAEPGDFGPVAGHAATHEAVVAAYSELSRVAPATLEALVAASGRGAEVVRLVVAIRAHLGDFYDEDDLAVAALDAVVGDASASTTTTPAMTAMLGAVVWHLPERTSPAMSRLIGAVLHAAPAATVIAGLTGDGDADASTRAACAAADVELSHDPAIDVPRAHRIISVSDTDEEVRAVLRAVMALAESGMRLDRMAVFVPAADPYARILIEQLGAAGIPFNGPGRRRLADTAAGRTLLAALDLRHKGWGRGDVMALVAGAPVRSGSHAAPAARWDELSREAGIVGGLDQWRTKLAVLSERLHRRGNEGATRRAEDVDELARFVEAVATDLAAMEMAPTWAARATAAALLLTRLLGPEHRRLAWPDGEVAAAARVDAALARLATLDDIEPAPTMSAFELAVSTELDARAGRVGRFGEGVLVAPLSSAVGLDLDAVFVLGMAEGTCPTFRRDDALLPDTDREGAAAGDLLTRRARLADQHRSFLAALAAGAEHRVLLFPRGDLRSRRGRLPSRWLLDTASHLSGRRLFSSDVASAPGSIVSTVASSSAALAGATVHGSVLDRDLAALLGFHAAGGDPAAHPLATEDGSGLGRGFTCRRARHQPEFTEWDGNLAGRAIPSPATGTPLSPTSLQTWAKCPFAYFLGDVLRLGDRTDPEAIVQIGAADRGTLVHAILERFIGEAINRDHGPPGPTEAWTEDDRARLRVIADEEFGRCEAEGKTGRTLTWQTTREEVLADLDKFLTKDDEFRSGAGAVPVAVELGFGRGREGDVPVEVRLAGGRVVSFKGKADRVDRTTSGRLVVTDYKTGKGKAYADLDDDPVQAGQTLQLGVYAEAALAAYDGDEAESAYWLATTDGRFVRHGYPWDAERRQRFLQVAEAIVDGIEQGTFPAQPGAYDSFFHVHENCRHCEFDRVCPRDRDDHAAAKADAPELAVLSRLQVPIAPTVAGDGE